MVKMQNYLKQMINLVCFFLISKRKKTPHATYVSWQRHTQLLTHIQTFISQSIVTMSHEQHLNVCDRWSLAQYLPFVPSHDSSPSSVIAWFLLPGSLRPPSKPWNTKSILESNENCLPVCHQKHSKRTKRDGKKLAWTDCAVKVQLLFHRWSHSELCGRRN